MNSRLKRINKFIEGKTFEYNHRVRFNVEGQPVRPIINFTLMVLDN